MIKKIDHVCRLYCPECRKHKVAYPTEADAMVSDAVVKYGNTPYYCRLCGGWHTTSHYNINYKNISVKGLDRVVVIKTIELQEVAVDGHKKFMTSFSECAKRLEKGVGILNQLKGIQSLIRKEEDLSVKSWARDIFFDLIREEKNRHARRLSSSFCSGFRKRLCSLLMTEKVATDSAVSVVSDYNKKFKNNFKVISADKEMLRSLILQLLNKMEGQGV